MARRELLKLFTTRTGKTIVHPPVETSNPFGYQRSRIVRINRMGSPRLK